MTTHLPPKELLGLPGMPKSVKGIHDQVNTGKLRAQPKKNKDGSNGKFIEIEVASLPPETQLHLTARRQPANLPAVRPASAPVATAALADYQRQCMDARLLLLNIVRTNAGQMGVKGAINQLIKAVNAYDNILPTHVLDAVPLANARKGQGGERTLSPRTMLRWWAEWKKSGFDTMKLAPDTMKDPKSGAIVAARCRVKDDPPWADDFMEFWRQPQKPELAAVLRKMAKDLPAAALVPSYDQARRYLKSIGQLEASRGRMTGNELRTIMPYRRRLTDHMYPGDCYTADGHTFDAEVAHPFHGRPFRPEITLVIDIATRYVVGWSCDLAESGLAVLDALRMACENLGPPVIFYTDNGPGYKNQLMTAPGTGILQRLSICPEYSRPRNPQAHGISERAHRTILVRAAKELCTYMGAAMDTDAKQLAYKETRAAARQGEISAIMLEFEEFVAHVNQAIEEYHHRPHRGLDSYRDQVSRKRIHLTPAQALALGIKRMNADMPADYRLAPANELPDLYHPAKECTVTRGCVTLGRKIYSAAADLKNYAGERVQVAFSPSDPAKVWVRNLNDGRLIAVARLNGNADQYFAKSYIEEKREDRAIGRIKRLKNHLEEAELERRGPVQVVMDHPPEIEAKRLTSVPVPEPEEAPCRPKVTPIRPEPAGFTPPESGQERWDLWCEIDARIKADDEVGEEELNFWTGFRKSGTWRAHDLIRQAAQ